MTAHVALLRGINVGGKNLLAMKALVAMFEDAGCTDVSTYIQSGNVVFRAPPRRVPTLAAAITRRIAAATGVQIPVLLRSHAELATGVRANPFLGRDPPPTALHVVFLAGRPTATAVAALDPTRSPPDEYAVVGREIYLRCPDGVGRSKLTTAYFDRALATISSGRNWRTVTTLLDLAAATAAR